MGEVSAKCRTQIESQSEPLNDSEQFWKLARKHLEDNFAVIDTQSSDVSEDVSEDTGEIRLEPLSAQEYPVLGGAYLIAKFWTDTTEQALFEQILGYLDTSKQASEIIKNGFEVYEV